MEKEKEKEKRSNFPTSVQTIALSFTARWKIDRNYNLFDSTSTHNKLMHKQHSKYSDIFRIADLEWQLCLCKNDSKSPLLIGINPVIDDDDKDGNMFGNMNDKDGNMFANMNLYINVISAGVHHKTTRQDGGDTPTNKMFLKDNVMWCMNNSFTGPFIVDVSFQFVRNRPISKPDGNLRLQEMSRQHRLASLGRMLSENIYTDITINTLDGVKISAHRAVLASRSPVFHSMFSHDLQEKEHSTINIPDISTNACQVFFKYIYGNMNAKELVEHRVELLRAADKYDFPELKEICVESFIHDTDRKNVIEMIRTADFYGLTKLKNRCMRFLVKSGYVFEIEDDLKELQQSGQRDLVDEIFREVLKELKSCSQGMDID